MGSTVSLPSNKKEAITLPWQVKAILGFLLLLGLLEVRLSMASLIERHPWPIAGAITCLMLCACITHAAPRLRPVFGIPLGLATFSALLIGAICALSTCVQSTWQFMESHDLQEHLRSIEATTRTYTAIGAVLFVLAWGIFFPQSLRMALSVGLVLMLVAGIVLWIPSVFKEARYFTPLFLIESILVGVMLAHMETNHWGEK